MKIKKQEYIDRMKLLQKSIVDNKLDAFLVTSQDSIYYLTGVTYVPLERPFFILVRSKRPPILLAPSLDREHLSSAPNVDELRSYWDYPSPKGMGWPEKLNEILKEVKRLGIEPALPQEIAAAIKKIKPEVLPLVETLRLVKSADEVAMIRQAAHYADMGMGNIIKTSYSGVSEIEVFSQSRAVQIKIIKETEFDALNTSILTAVWPARLCTQPHGVPDVADRLKGGPHIALSFLRANGYAAECERTFFVSPPSQAMKEMFNIMLEARKRAFALIRPGVPCAEIDIAANGFLREQGLGDYLLHRTGHGLGLGNHEGPWVADGSADILKPNMVISIEPGIYIKDLGGFRHSDTVLVTPGGYECLTMHPADLDSLTLRSAKILTRLRGVLIRKAVGIKD
jgi:Xaa-Pro aminopeptidase